ncbi:MAG: DUF4838 domain-containing protein [Armatimonadota bacterium]
MTTVQAQTLTLAKDGEARAVVGVAADAPDVTRFAAEELAAYLGRITGGTFEVLEISEDSPATVQQFGGERLPVLVGASRYTDRLQVGLDDLAPDGFRIVTLPQALVIAGIDDSRVNPRAWRSLGSAGSLYGVYRFLEELGCRFYLPGEVGEVIPSSPSLWVSRMDIADAPYFRERLGQPPLGGEEAAVWMRKLGFGATEYPQASCHSFNRWPEKYKQAHPEYFALHGDRRINHICFSHPDARQQMIEDARSWLREHDADLYPYFTVMQNDGAPGPCRCELCQPHIRDERGWMGLQSDLVASAAVEVARAIADEFPERGIIIGAYNDYTLPPTEIDRLPDNVSVCIFKHRQMFWDEEGYEGFKRVLDGWLELQPQSVAFWEYYNFDCWAGAAWGGVPAVTTGLIAEDIRHLKRTSEETGIPFSGELIFCDGRLQEHWHDRLWWMGLDFYVTGKLLWDPERDLEAMLDEFLTTFFGPAAEPMSRFYDRAEEVWTTGDHGGIYGYADPSLKTLEERSEAMSYSADPWEHLFTPDVVAELNGILKKAEMAAPRAPYAARVAMVRSGFNWTMQRAAGEDRQEE